MISRDTDSHQRPMIFAGNWKMNHTPGEALAYFAELQGFLAEMKKAPTDPSRPHMRVICPPAYCLSPQIQQAAAHCHVELGSQNIHWDTKGAFTGELSGSAMHDMGIRWTLIGHSERRQFFGETDETATRRLKQALQLGFNIIYCIGETLAEREASKTKDVLSRQLQPILKVLRENTPQPATKFSIAYEPVWAIGTGKTATAAQAQEAHHFIRGTLMELWNRNQADLTALLYGGSVTPENVKELLAQTDVDGVLAGGASLKAESFAKILTA